MEVELRGSCHLAGGHSQRFITRRALFLRSTEKTTLLYVLSFGTTVCGLFTTISGILGFLGAVCRSPCLLALTATILLVPLAASIYISNKETSALRASVRLIGAHYLVVRRAEAAVVVAIVVDLMSFFRRVGFFLFPRCWKGPRVRRRALKRDDATSGMSPNFCCRRLEKEREER